MLCPIGKWVAVSRLTLGHCNSRFALLLRAMRLPLCSDKQLIFYSLLLISYLLWRLSALLNIFAAWTEAVRDSPADNRELLTLLSIDVRYVVFTSCPQERASYGLCAKYPLPTRADLAISPHQIWFLQVCNVAFGGRPASKLLHLRAGLVKRFKQ